MGLDVTAYSNLRAVTAHGGDLAQSWCDNDGHIKTYTISAFPDSFRGLDVLGKNVGYFFGPCLEMRPNSRAWSFHDSYPGYDAWREELAARFNPIVYPPEGRGWLEGPKPDLPFYELIWFADNEGFIGPEAAKDLLDDFREHDVTVPDPEPFSFEATYAHFFRACELAADNGVIWFH